MTIAITDPWVERHITAGKLASGARSLSREDAARQYNSSNALDPSDPDYMFTPGQARAIAIELLTLIGIEVPDGTRIMLSDGPTGRWCGNHLVNPGQLEFAVEQDHQISGERLSVDALIGALPWA